MTTPITQEQALRQIAEFGELQNAQPVAYHYKYSIGLHKDVWGVGYNVPKNATEHYPLFTAPPEPQARELTQPEQLPSRIALEKVVRLEAEGFTRYLATPLRRSATTDRAADYCIVGHGGDVRWCGNEPEARELSDSELLKMWLEAVQRAYTEDEGEAHEFFARAVLAARGTK